eukprot:2875930-Prymnesium_polylepis.1
MRTASPRQVRYRSSFLLMKDLPRAGRPTRAITIWSASGVSCARILELSERVVRRAGCAGCTGALSAVALPSI